jgi:hypothetical protein
VKHTCLNFIVLASLAEFTLSVSLLAQASVWGGLKFGLSETEVKHILGGRPTSPPKDVRNIKENDNTYWLLQIAAVQCSEISELAGIPELQPSPSEKLMKLQLSCAYAALYFHERTGLERIRFNLVSPPSLGPDPNVGLAHRIASHIRSLYGPPISDKGCADTKPKANHCEYIFSKNGDGPYFVVVIKDEDIMGVRNSVEYRRAR